MSFTQIGRVTTNVVIDLEKRHALKDVTVELEKRSKAKLRAASIPELAGELAGQLDQRNKMGRVAWDESSTRYRNRIIDAVRKLREIEGATAVMVFLDEIIVGKVGGK